MYCVRNNAFSCVLLVHACLIIHVHVLFIVLQLMYAEIDVAGGSGKPVNRGPDTSYATVVN